MHDSTPAARSRIATSGAGWVNASLSLVARRRTRSLRRSPA